MKERPILFSAPMVRAILAGTKTQTRRIMNPQPDIVLDGVAWRKGTSDRPHVIGGIFGRTPHNPIRCPHGAPGDRLWVRETWAGDSACGYVYRAEHPNADLRRGDLDDGEQEIRAWRPSIFMPRGASRITLDIVSVRVERLQDITDADIAAEGVTADTCAELLTGRSKSPHLVEHWTPRDWWRLGWDAINGKRAPWASNPWVWAIGFKRAEVGT